MFIVTLDGPMASGKTSTSRAVSKRLKWKWLSTGAFYRGLAYISKFEVLNIENEESVAQLISSQSWRVEMGEDSTQFFYNNKDITDEIYEEEIGQISSYISRYPKVRENLIQVQRDYVHNAGSEGILVEGRDCGTALFPMASVKFYVTAVRDERMKRMFLDEKRRKGQKASSSATDEKKDGSQDQKLEKDREFSLHEASFYYRDIQDSSRSLAPLRIPKQAYFVNTSDMSLDEVEKYVYRIVLESFQESQ